MLISQQLILSHNSLILYQAARFKAGKLFHNNNPYKNKFNQLMSDQVIIMDMGSVNKKKSEIKKFMGHQHQFQDLKMSNLQVMYNIRVKMLLGQVWEVIRLLLIHHQILLLEDQLLLFNQDQLSSLSLMFNLKPLLSSNHKLQLMSNQQQPHTPNNSNKSHLTLNQLPLLTLNNRIKLINLYNKLHQKLSFKQNGQNNNFKDQNIQNFITTVQNIIEI